VGTKEREREREREREGEIEMGGAVYCYILVTFFCFKLEKNTKIYFGEKFTTYFISFFLYLSINSLMSKF
jgi:hypothetical protein